MSAPLRVAGGPQGSVPGQELAEAQRCLTFALRKAAREVTRAYDAALRPTGLRSTQFNLLVALNFMGPITTTKLAEYLAAERTTLTRNLSLLAGRGLVKVGSGGGDRRSRPVAITPAGRAAALRALPAWRRAQAAMGVQLGARELESFVDRLGALVRHRP